MPSMSKQQKGPAQWHDHLAGPFLLSPQHWDLIIPVVSQRSASFLTQCKQCCARTCCQHDSEHCAHAALCSGIRLIRHRIDRLVCALSRILHRRILDIRSVDLFLDQFTAAFSAATVAFTSSCAASSLLIIASAFFSAVFTSFALSVVYKLRSKLFAASIAASSADLSAFVIDIRLSSRRILVAS